MVAPRTLWHLMLYALLQERRPRAFEVRFEVTLTKEPQRADFLLLRKNTEDDLSDARVLRKLWGLIRKDAVVEYKSVKRLVQPGDLTRLLGYGAQYATLHRKRLADRRDLTLVLLVPSVTPTLSRELEFLGAVLGESEGGYAPVEGLSFPAWSVFIDEVSVAERDGLLGMFGHGGAVGGEDLRWWFGHLWNKEQTMAEIDPRKLEGYEELVAEFLAKLTPEERLQGLRPEEVLEFFQPEERLQGLRPEEVLEFFQPEERLQGLRPEDLIRALTPGQRRRLRDLLEEEEN